MRDELPPKCAQSPTIVDLARKQLETSFRRRICHPDPLITAIALLTDDELDSMNHFDQLEVIRIAETIQADCADLRSACDRSNGDLHQKLYLLRAWSRFQVNTQAEEDGDLPFFENLL